MKIINLHPWNVTSKEAREIQDSLKKAVKIKRIIDPEQIKTIAGADISYCKKSRQLFAAVMVFRMEDFSLIEQVESSGDETFPYIPGYLSFREAPFIVSCMKKLKTKPDVLVLDGQGIAHPRRFGLACHIGLFTNVPTIGCAKKRLTGTYDDPEKKRGSHTPLRDKGETIGAVLRTKNNVKPLFISPGHNITLNDAVTIILKVSGDYRIPLPTRMAHLHVNTLRQSMTEE